MVHAQSFALYIEIIDKSRHLFRSQISFACIGIKIIIKMVLYLVRSIRTTFGWWVFSLNKSEMIISQGRRAYSVKLELERFYTMVELIV